MAQEPETAPETASREAIDTEYYGSAEFFVPIEVIIAETAILYNEDWDSVLRYSTQGRYIDRNRMRNYKSYFGFLPFVNSNKEIFFRLLKEHTDFSDADISKYYGIMTSPGNLAMAEGTPLKIIYHERTHKYLSEKLTKKEENLLTESMIAFQKWAMFTMVDESEDPLTGEIVPVSFSSKYAGFKEGLIFFTNWQELYAHMASDKVYPPNIPDLQPEFYAGFRERHPEAYKIYERMLRDVPKPSDN